ncbi:MAG: hypothetical protein SNH55_01470 [Rikenellaceae bacterium]
MALHKPGKRRIVTSINNLSQELQDRVKEHYPLGYTDAMMRIDKPNGDFFYAVPYSTDEVEYLVKIDVKIDDKRPDDDDKGLYDDDLKEDDSMGGVDDHHGDDDDDDM